MLIDSTPVFAPTERRRVARYPVMVEIAFDGGTGTTRDISAAGVYFTTTAVPPLGAHLAIEVEARHFLITSPLAVRCRCRVVRIQSLEGQWGVAVAIDEVVFDRPAQATAPGAASAP